MSEPQQKKRRQIKIARMEIVSQLYKRAYSYRKMKEEVMKRLGLKTYSLDTLKNDIQTLLKEWRQERINNIDYALQLELERIDDCVKELWEQWEKSKEDYLRENNKRVGIPAISSNGEAEIQTVRRVNAVENVVGLGNPAYIAEIRQQLAERRKLLGLYAATKTEVTGKDGTPLIPAEKMTEEEIKAEIERIRKSRAH